MYYLTGRTLLTLCLVLVLCSSCSTFESFHFKIPIEMAYGDAAVQSEQAAAVAKIEADKQVMLAGKEPHTVQVLFPGDAPPVAKVLPVASTGAVTADGIVLYDCRPTKGGLVECRGELEQ